jgi:hypothetical protein
MNFPSSDIFLDARARLDSCGLSKSASFRRFDSNGSALLDPGRAAQR